MTKRLRRGVIATKLKRFCNNYVDRKWKSGSVKKGGGAFVLVHRHQKRVVASQSQMGRLFIGSLANAAFYHFKVTGPRPVPKSIPFTFSAPLF